MLDDSFNDVGSDNSNQSSPRLRLPSPSVDKIDRISRPGMWQNWVMELVCMFRDNCRREISSFWGLIFPGE